MLTVLKQPEFPLVPRPTQDSTAATETGTLQAPNSTQPSNGQAWERFENSSQVSNDDPQAKEGLTLLDSLLAPSQSRHSHLYTGYFRKMLTIAKPLLS